MIHAPFQHSSTQQPSAQQPSALQWQTVCPLDQITPNTGVCALVGTQQVAIFRIKPQPASDSDTSEPEKLYAIDNYDPFSHTYVLARGIVGDRQGIPKVASPIYKQNFNLITGECWDAPGVRVTVFPVQVVAGQVQVGMMPG